jgi:hypothetical protein
VRKHNRNITQNKLLSLLESSMYSIEGNEIENDTEYMAGLSANFSC